MAYPSTTCNKPLNQSFNHQKSINSAIQHQRSTVTKYRRTKGTKQTQEPTLREPAASAPAAPPPPPPKSASLYSSYSTSPSTASSASAFFRSAHQKPHQTITTPKKLSPTEATNPTAPRHSPQTLERNQRKTQESEGKHMEKRHKKLKNEK